MQKQKATAHEGSRTADLGEETAVADPREATWLALAYAATALAMVGLWGLIVGPATHLEPFTFTALVAASFLASRIVLPISPRSWYTVSTPIVLLTGLVGGPLAGAIAGAATVVGDDAGTWRRRAAYGGLNSVQGFAAGLAGMVPFGGPNRSLACATIAALVFLLTNLAGRFLVRRARKISVQCFVRPETMVDTLETVVSVPLLALLLQSYDSSGPVLMLTTIGALLVALYVGTKARERYLVAIAEGYADARTDRLTGAPNRRAYDEELARVVARVARGEHPAGLLVFDIDHFKQINTNHTWTGGDDLLRAITERVETVLRSTDHLSRRGGEEFCVIAPGVRDAAGLGELGRKVHGIVRMAPFMIGGVLVDVTVSVGATLIDGSLSSAAADSVVNDALAEAKLERDCLVIRLPVPEQGNPRTTAVTAYA